MDTATKVQQYLSNFGFDVQMEFPDIWSMPDWKREEWGDEWGDEFRADFYTLDSMGDDE